MPSLQQKQKLIEEIKGIRRVVINKCHGGFGLSEEAVLHYLDLRGIKVWPEKSEKFSGLLGPTYWLVPPDGDRVKDATPEEWSAMSLSERSLHNKQYSEQIFDDRDIARDDPYLAQTVLELGDAASGRHAELSVVEIPEDVDWIIEEYDGLEWVAERHRTWS